jgi:hypothetical protein
MKPAANQSDAKPAELKYGTTGDAFKPLAEMMLPDVRQQCWGRLQPDGTIRKIQLEDLYNRMGGLVLNPTVPEDVRTGFDTARNLFLYSWFVYRFQTVAALQAYAALDFALGKRIENERTGKCHGLARRLELAVQKGWLCAEGIRIFQRAAACRTDYDATSGRMLREYLAEQGIVLNENRKTETEHARDYLADLKKGVPQLRNSMAHGKPLLGAGAVVAIEICCDFINQLFPETRAK